MKETRVKSFTFACLLVGCFATATAQVTKTTETFEYPTKKMGGVPVTALSDGEEYAMQNSNTTLECRNLYWEWGTYLRTRSDGKINDVTLIAHKHESEGKDLWSFQISSETGNGQYMGQTNGSNVQITSDEILWNATYVQSDGVNGFVLLQSKFNPDEGHELVINGSGDWVVCYDDGASTDKTDGTSYWSFIRTMDLNSESVVKYNETNLMLYQLLVEASQMYDRGMTEVVEVYNAGVSVYNNKDNTTDELMAAVEAIEAVIKSSVANYELGVPATYGIVNPSFENTSAQYGTDRSVPFGWTMTNNGNEVSIPSEWAWCGVNADADSTDGSYIWGMWHWGSYGDIELSQTLCDLPNGLYKLTARLMNNNTESGNLSRIFADDNSILAGGAANYTTLPENENCNYGNGWAVNDFDLSHVMSVYANVTDGTLKIGAKTNGFFKIDDFRLTYLGNETVKVSVEIGLEGVLPIVTSAPIDMSLRDDVKAYIVDGEGDLAEIKGVIASGQPIILIGAQGNYELDVIPQSETAIMADNALRVANGDVVADGSTIYTYANGNQGTGFYLQPAEAIVENGSVYLQTTGTMNAEFVKINSDITSIHVLPVISRDNRDYDLSGRRVNSTYRGLVISNRKKHIQ